MSNPPIIVGAGLAGLIAAHAWPNLEVFEAASEPSAMHKAVLRFRNDSVSRMTGIEFKQVRVRKGIWSANAFREPNIRLANMYAKKVLGHIAGERSIWNVAAADRYVAPDDFYEQLIGATRGRIEWNTEINFKSPGTKINTAPMPVVLGDLRSEALAVGYSDLSLKTTFQRSPIRVIRAKVNGADVYQTVYFPDDDSPMYRATITGDNLIMELVVLAGQDSMAGVQRSIVNAERAFSLGSIELLDVKPHEQKYGKIVPIQDEFRKKLLFNLTHKHNIYSLGRFATWRNILLDDVVEDIEAIKRLLRTASDYELRRHHS